MKRPPALLSYALRALLLTCVLLLRPQAEPLEAQEGAETAHSYTFGQTLEITLALPEETQE
ncbi:MAG: hypothetical protein ACLFU8_18035, partial [Anaerolineales bacterium]